jgi:hypothetical protein
MLWEGEEGVKDRDKNAASAKAKMSHLGRLVKWA